MRRARYGRASDYRLTRWKIVSTAAVIGNFGPPIPLNGTPGQGRGITVIHRLFHRLLHSVITTVKKWYSC